MNRPKEIAAGVLDTLTTAFETKRIPILNEFGPDAKAFTTIQAEAALRGWELARVRRLGDDRITYLLKSWNDTRTFDSWHSVVGCIASLPSWGALK